MIETFPIVPGSVRMLWLIVPVCLLVAAAVAGLIHSLSGARNARFEVSPAGLRLRGDFYGRLIPPSELRLDEARAVNLDSEPSLAPRIRLVGTAISGYRAGWFRLRNGERALLYVTDTRRIAYLPTVKGYAILLSVADPDALLASLRRMKPAA
jgi:hypothetical protein